MSALDRLAKLTTQAERAPEGSPEREAFMAKALALSQAIGIDLAVARAHQADKEKRETPEKRRIAVGTYSTTASANGHKVRLLSAIAASNDVTLTIGYHNAHVEAYGFPSDLDMCERLFAVLSTQMVAEADAALKRGANKYTIERAEQVQRWTGEYDEDWYGNRMRVREPVYNADGSPKMRLVKHTYSDVDGRVWRANFYAGFVSATRARLWTARREALAARGETQQESESTALALKDRATEVDQFYQEEVKHLTLGTWKPPSTREQDYSAQHAGGKAARDADLGEARNTVGADGRKAL